MHIQHITLRVKNLEASLEFYQTMVELSVSRRFTHGAIELVFLTHGEGETEIELLHQPGGQTFEGKGMFICFATDRLDEQHQLAAERDGIPLRFRCRVTARGILRL